MTHFPKAVLPPQATIKARDERKSHVFKAMFIGISIRSLIIATEFMGVFLFGSSALLMDALASFLDVLSSLFLIIFIKLAERPPDENHPFGHGRFEPLAGLQLGLLLTLVGLGMSIFQLMQINDGFERKVSSVAWFIPLVAVILLEVCYYICKYVAKKHHSPAMLAEAFHYRVDSLTSFFALIALSIAAFFPAFSGIIDHSGAIFISLIMIVLGIISMKSNLHQLLDRIPDDKYFRKVKRAAQRVHGVKDTEKIRLQLYGPDAHVNIDVEVDPKLSVEKAHEISQKVRAEIQKEWPAVRDVTVHIEPYYPGDH